MRLSLRLLASSAAVVALSSAIFVYASHPSRASDHQDSPFVISYPNADITDVFAFPSPRDSSKVVLVMDVVPLIPAGNSQYHALNPHALYQFKMSHVAGGPSDLIFALQPFSAGTSQTIGVYEAKNVDKLSGILPVMKKPIGYVKYNDAAGTTFADGVTAFVGPRADPFFFDLFQFFKILPDRDYHNPRTGDTLGTSTPTFNGYPSGSLSGAGGYACSTAPSTNALTQIGGGFNVVSIVLEIPRSLLATKSQSPVVHLWATTSAEYEKNGQIAFKQIELLSRPAVKELFEPFAMHATTNEAEPYNDPAIKSSISYFMANVAGRSPAISNVIESVLYPNEMAFDISQSGPAAYLGVETGGATGGKFGGRGLTDNVIDTSLGVVFGGTIPALGLAPDDGKENGCLTSQHVTSGQGGMQTQATYPFLAQPH
jgi:hypothetical protein